MSTPPSQELRAEPASAELVILVDEQDRQTGVLEKMAAHLSGVLHRAFSIFVFNSRGEVLLQQRAAAKYHSSGLWSNTCCSHPRPEESLQQAMQRRLREELGFACRLKKAFQFIYRAELASGLIEHELDHVYCGFFEGEIRANRDEVQAFRWMSLPALQRAVRNSPEQFTVWLRLILQSASFAQVDFHALLSRKF